MITEQAASVAEGPKDGLLAVDAGGTNPLLPATRHPGPGQMGMQVKLGFILIPQFIVGVGI
jgi:hypothetical protein